MTEVKMITVSQKTIGHTTYPRILFNDEWLIKLGFKTETLVSAIYENDTLKLKAHGTGLEIYKTLVADIRRKRGQLFQVLKTKPSVSEQTNRKLDLAIEGGWLSRQSFTIGDVLIVRFKNEHIEIKKIDPLVLGLPQSDQFRLIQVGTYKTPHKVVPQILIAAEWLNDYGFGIDSKVALTYGDDTICFTICDEMPIIPRGTKQPSHKVIRQHCRKRKQVSNRLRPTISLNGYWLSDLGYQSGDYLVLAVNQNHIILKRLDSTLLFED